MDRIASPYLKEVAFYVVQMDVYRSERNLIVFDRFRLRDR